RRAAGACSGALCDRGRQPAADGRGRDLPGRAGGQAALGGGSMALQRPAVGVAAIVMRGERVLLGRRRSGHGAGTWQFPGGHLEWGESIEACARREVLEETGLVVTGLRRGPFTNDIFADE